MISQAIAGNGATPFLAIPTDLKLSTGALPTTTKATQLNRARSALSSAKGGVKNLFAFLNLPTQIAEIVVAGYLIHARSIGGLLDRVLRLTV